MKTKHLPSQSLLRELLHYNPETGHFHWRVQVAFRCPPGTLAGCQVGSQRYRTIGVQKTIYLAHRLAWVYMTGEIPPDMVDHINGDATDNRWANLRLANRCDNQRNSRTPVTNTSGFKGVSWDRHTNKFRAYIRVDGKTKNLGSFLTPELAHDAYKAAAIEHYGDFSRFS